MLFVIVQNLQISSTVEIAVAFTAAYIWKNHGEMVIIIRSTHKLQQLLDYAKHLFHIKIVPLRKYGNSAIK